VAVVIARLVLKGDADAGWLVAAAAFFAIAGHVFPVWLRFRGGKGVATAVGAFLLLAPLALACVLPVFVVAVWATRYVSLGSITAAALMPLAVWLVGGRGGSDENMTAVLTATVAGAALIIFMHRANIGRLLRGEENRLKL
jgi:glycerol-3-phosphate acyltransferase PlsY